MGIRFSGISSGLPVDDIIAQLIAVERRPITLLMQRRDKISAQQSQYTAVSTRISNLRSTLTKLTDARLGTAFDLFEAKKVTSSNTSAVTATVTNTATVGSFAIDVLRLATATRASSTTTVGQATDATSNVSDVAEGGIKSGDFTLFVNNQAQTISVDTTVDTVQDVLDRIETAITNVAGPAANPAATVDATGKISITYKDGNTVRFGASGDTSNFATLTHLTTGTETDIAGANTQFVAKYATSIIDKQGTLTDNAARLNTAVTAGTVTIGNAQFTIDATTTLEKLLADISASKDAGVTATYNSTTNKVELVSKSTGNTAITLGDASDTSNFLEAVGLVSGGDSLSSQTLGNNAQFTVNGGSTLESASNTVDASISGLTGVTLTLLDETAGTPATLSVAQDTDTLKTAVKDFVDKLNSALSFIDDQTKKGAILNGEAPLLRLRNELRSETSGEYSLNSVYKILSQIGISTGSVNPSPSEGSTPPNSFSFNESKFLEALANDPDEVKKLLVGDGTTSGILNVLEESVKGALDPEFGVFSSRNDSANAQIKSINEAISRGEDRLLVKEKQLRAQFAAMERLMAQLQQQQASINAFG